MVAVSPFLGAAEQASNQEDAIRQAVSKFWDAIKVFDLATAYHLEAGASDGDLTATAFREYWSDTDWELRSYEIRSITIDGDEADVDLLLLWHPPQLPKDVSRPFDDRWRYHDGAWLRDSGDYSSREEDATTL
jgi:hypothetical protein